MKKLILLACLLVAATVQAQEVGHLINDDGGKIVLLDEPCSEDKPDSKVYTLYATGTRSNRALYGCWGYSDNTIIAIYEDDVSAKYHYNPANVIMNPNYKKKE